MTADSAEMLLTHTGLVIAEPFISPFTFTITPALSLGGITSQAKRRTARLAIDNASLNLRTLSHVVRVVWETPAPP